MSSVDSIFIKSSGFIEDLIPQQFLDLTHGDQERKKTGIKAAIGLLQIADKALALLPYKLQCSDGSAADNACQIRAIEIAILAKKVLGSDPSLIRGVREDLGAKIKCLRAAFGKLGGRQKMTNISEILGRDCFLDPDVRIYLLSFLLSGAKQMDEKDVDCPCGKTGKQVRETINSQNLVDVPQVLQKPLIIRAQELLAQESCARLIQLVRERGIPIAQKLTEKVVKFVDRKLPPIQEQGMEVKKFDPRAPTRKIKHQDEKEVRVELPCFFTIEALFQLAASFGVPILIKKIEMSHRFEQKTDPQKKDVVLCFASFDADLKSVVRRSDTSYPKDHPVVVIEGYTSQCLQQRPLPFQDPTFDYAPIIRMNAASHPQYSDGRDVGERAEERRGLIFAREDITELALLDKLSQEVGCSQENPSGFCTFHVFASTLEEASGGVS